MNIPPPSKLAELGAFDDAPKPTAEQIRAQNELFDWHAEWAAGQVRAGVDGPVPAGRPAGSDYNLHVPDLNADADAEDEFHVRAREILGITQ